MADVLFIADNAGEVEQLADDIRQATGAGHTVIGLALWPDAYRAFSGLGVEVQHSSQWVDRGEHQALLTEMKGMRQAWQQAIRATWPGAVIDGLDLPEAFGCEMEALVSAILFDLRATELALTSARPRRVYMVERSREGSSANHLVSTEVPARRVDYMDWLRRQRAVEAASLSDIVEKLALDCGAEPCLRPASTEPLAQPAASAMPLGWKLMERGFTVYRRLRPQRWPELRRRVRSSWWAGHAPPPSSIGHPLLVAEAHDRGKGALLDALERKGYVCLYAEDAQRLAYAVPGATQPSPLASDAPVQAVANAVLVSVAALEGRHAKLLAPLLSHVTADLVETYFPTAARHYLVMRQFAERYRPRVYFLGHAGLHVFAEAWAFHCAGVPVVTVPHGLAAGYLNPDLWPCVSEEAWGAGHVWHWCTSKMVWRTLVDRGGIPPSTVAVTGSLESGIVCQQKGRSSSWLLRRLLGIPARKKVVVYAEGTEERGGRRLLSDETSSETWETTRQVVAACSDLKDVVLIVKLHPGTSELEAFHEICRAGRDVRLMRNIPFDKLLSITDLVITFNSSCGLEGLLRGVPLIIYSSCPRPGYLAHLATGLGSWQDTDDKLAISATGPEDLRRAIWALLEDGALKQSLAAKLPRVLPLWIKNADPQFEPVESALALMTDLKQPAASALSRRQPLT